MLEISVVLPTFNERAHIEELVQRVGEALAGLRWEIVFVDDDSADGTAEAIRRHACVDSRIRLIHRIGRRGLASACTEGILAASAPMVAVMDADLQHDETILPRMLQQMRGGDLDVVVGTRNAEGGSMGEFAAGRVRLSEGGRKVAGLISRCQVSDPMSGFFLVRRAFFVEAARRMQGGGFKILLDLLASSPEPARVGEVGYTFRCRRFGESKLDLNTGVEYGLLVVSKLTRGVVPARFALFCMVGTVGMAAHLLVLSGLLRGMGANFFSAQMVASFAAMTVNFFLNNMLTFRDRRLHGMGLVLGLLSFYVACSFGAWANTLLSYHLYMSGVAWPLAGLAGVIVGSVWNYSMTNLFTWQRRAGRVRRTVVQPLPVDGSL